MKPLPKDASIDALGTDERSFIAGQWAGRAAAELRASLSFAVIADTLDELDAEPELRAMARRAIDEERRHAALCNQVASAYLGREAPPPVELPLVVPEHPGATPELRRTLHVLGMCAINETSGGAYLEACLHAATAPLARAALRELLSDEVDHARIGWAHLASPRLSLDVRVAVGPWIRPMIAASLAGWRDRSALPWSQTWTAHGCPSFDLVETAVVGAMRDLVLPGFARFGHDLSYGQGAGDIAKCQM